MRTKGAIRTCIGCGKQIRERVGGGGLRAHKCRHGNPCGWSSFSPNGHAHGIACPECIRERSSAIRVQASELEKLVMDLAFAIEDPCGVEAIGLARALVMFGQTAPEANRALAIQCLVELSQRLSEGQPECRQQHSNKSFCN